MRAEGQDLLSRLQQAGYSPSPAAAAVLSLPLSDVAPPSSNHPAANAAGADAIPRPSHLPASDPGGVHTFPGAHTLPAHSPRSHFAAAELMARAAPLRHVGWVSQVLPASLRNPHPQPQQTPQQPPQHPAASTTSSHPTPNSSFPAQLHHLTPSHLNNHNNNSNNNNLRAVPLPASASSSSKAVHPPHFSHHSHGGGAAAAALLAPSLPRPEAARPLGTIPIPITRGAAVDGGNIIPAALSAASAAGVAARSGSLTSGTSGSGTTATTSVRLSSGANQVGAVCMCGGGWRGGGREGGCGGEGGFGRVLGEFHSPTYPLTKLSSKDLPNECSLPFSFPSGL